MSVRATAAPDAANARAVARPIPAPAPVTRATWPLKSYVGFMWCCPFRCRCGVLAARRLAATPSDGLATVDDQGVAGGEGGGVRAEPDTAAAISSGRGARSAHPRSGRPVLRGCFGEALDHLGVDDAGQTALARTLDAAWSRAVERVRPMTRCLAAA